AALAGFYKIAPEHIVVAHDELDFLPGVAKMKQGGSSAGHNGLKDISARIGPNYWRLRIGIGHPRSLALNQEVADFVLHRPSREHQAAIEHTIDKALDVVPLLVQGDLTRAMQRLHSA
ncbi:MAG TPA: aminoacyl-tRNA hydrolase, partial [Burkholderiaceae bacterium]|nr:aminoacyl-tRNA hydrolase [Burkholderiaceae bacterium]